MQRTHGVATPHQAHREADMLPGPVFHLELLTTARRARYYAVRFLYGMVLLFFICQNNPATYNGHSLSRGGEFSIEEMALIGQQVFRTFATTQAVAVLLLTPALVAGVIADERQRKTLHYLLASRLSSGEIILGKLAARLLHIGVFLSIGLPIMSLLSLFGGVDPAVVVGTYAATCSAAFFLAALSILASTLARRPREAITLVYLLELAWLFLPTALAFLLPSAGWYWRRIYEWIQPINDWIAPSSPFHLLAGGPGLWGTTGALLRSALWMIGLQVGYGVLFLVVAVARLRPSLRNEGGRRRLRWLGGVQRARRFLPRPECGADPMLWKECFVARTSGTTKLTMAVIVLVVAILLGYYTVDYAGKAFIELAQNGYGSVSNTSARNQLNGFLRIITAMIYVALGLGVASAASSSMTSEREEDTWTSLLTTPLDGVEIVRAKMLGAVWGMRALIFFLLALWLTGLAAGAVHPFGFVAVVVETAVFAWFVTALGTFLSLMSRTTTRALMTTIAILIFLNGGYLMCCIPFRPDSGLILLGVTPFIEVFSLASYDEVQSFLRDDRMLFGRGRDLEMVVGCVLGLLAYAAAAFCLTQSALVCFDREVDRPRRSGAGPTASDHKKPEPIDGLEESV
jgi:ABC-type transport system involved in multi-copper enzyme maturation permease subunit